MAAVTRYRTSLAVSGILSLLMTSNTALMSPAAAAAAPPPGITLEMVSGGEPPDYRVEVRNGTNTDVTTTIRQNLPKGAAVASVSDGGRIGPAGPTGTEVVWELHLPAQSTKSLRTTLKPSNITPLAAPTCAFVAGSAMAYDCATAIWGMPSDSSPWWRKPPVVVVGILVALLALAGLGWWWLVPRRSGGGGHTTQRNRTPQGGSRTPAPARSSPRGLVRATASGPEQPRPAGGAPPTWQVVGAAAVLLMLSVGGMLWFAGRQVTAMGPNAESTSGAWVGTAVSGRIGMPMQDVAFEFTVYRLACASDQEQAGQRCEATVGLRNHSDTKQPWYAGMQRAYLSNDSWVTADADATREANGGHDIFAHPIPSGGQLLAPLVFTVPAGATPTKIELRSAVFPAGVSVVP